MSDPQVTIVIPARDEAGAIAACIDAIGAQDHPLADLEVVVVDGGSTDGTGAVAAAALARHPFGGARVVEHHPGTTPANLNRGLALARGRYLCRVDARSLVPPAYVRRCVEVLASRPEVAVVGGAQVARPGAAGPVATGIARALNNRGASGWARYRRGAASGPADTVYLGAFRVDDLRTVGGWDERLATNQDFDLNRRLGRDGTVWFDAELRVGYVARPDLRALARQYVRFGRWKVRYWRLTGDRPRPRQVALLAAPPVAAAAAVAVLARAGRRSRFGWIAAGVAGLGLVEARGAGEPAGGVPAHVAGAAALVTVGAGWWAGAVREYLRPPRDMRR